MSDRRLRAPVTAPTTTAAAAAAKRPRKPSLRNTDDDKQRERKRALDRKAQRASREKTRSHIAHLEQMVQILSDKNGSAATSELMEEMSRLHAEIDRLRKIIDSIKSVLGADILESTAPAPQPPRYTYSPSQPSAIDMYRHPPERDNNAQQSHKSPSPSPNHAKLCEVHSPDANQHLQAPTDSWEDQDPSLEEDMGAMGGMPVEVGDGLPDRNMDTDSNCTRNTFSWGNSGIDETSVALTSRWDGMRSARIFEHTPFWNLPSPLKTGMPEPRAPDFIPCKIWQKANAIYAGIFDYPRDRVAVANHVDEGSLIKAVKEGWGSLSLTERANPVLQILKEVDQNLFWDLDPVTKIANLYKSMLLLKYYFNAETQNLEKMPLWQRPVHAQKVRRHPIPIDFFPWPALRDRLIRHHNYYFATNEFSVHYRRHFRFSWPFGFDETYRYDPATETYHLSPLFERYHRDMRCWSLERVFFQKFPELIGEISVYRMDPGGASSSSTLPGHVDPRLGYGMQLGGYSTREQMPGYGGVQGWGFADEGVMQMFNEYPPT